VKEIEFYIILINTYSEMIERSNSMITFANNNIQKCVEKIKELIKDKPR
jgi:hypothetical protein